MLGFTTMKPISIFQSSSISTADFADGNPETEGSYMTCAEHNSYSDF
jgi:hypothetical protein